MLKYYFEIAWSVSYLFRLALLIDLIHLYLEDFTSPSSSHSRSSHNRSTGHWPLRSSNSCLLRSVFYPKPMWSVW